MAIVIPSKNIYDINNPKVRDNLVNNVKVNETIVTPINGYEEAIDNFSIKDKVWADYEDNNYIKKYRYQFLGEQNKLPLLFQIISLGYFSKKQKNILNHNISRKLNNKIIANLAYEDNENVKVGVSLYGKTIKGTVTGVFKDVSSSFEDIKYYPTEEKIGRIQIPPIITHTINSSFGEEYSYSASESLKTKYIYALSAVQENNFEITLFYTFPTKILKLYGERKISTEAENTGIHTVGGEYEEYDVEQIDFSIYGNTVGIDLTNGSVTYGSGNKPTSLNGNELMQDTAMTNGTLTTEHLANKVLNQYANGKETATILCDINEYYQYTATSQRGKLEISTIDTTLPMMFQIGDEVIPMVRGANGQDEPMSKDQNGTAKWFRVVGVRPFYDGAVWQELTLQEITEDI